MKLIVGLGNPEDKYAGTRHNLGFDLVEVFRRKKHPKNWGMEKQFNTQIVKSPDLILAKPQTYMNKSGFAVAGLAQYFKVVPEDIIILHDELDLPLGHIRLRLGGAAGGHHGVESVINYLKTDQFVRVRLGIGNWKTTSSEHGGNTLNVEHFVLETFADNEKPTVKSMLKKALKALELLLEKGLDKAQKQFN